MEADVGWIVNILYCVGGGGGGNGDEESTRVDDLFVTFSQEGANAIDKLSSSRLADFRVSLKFITKMYS